MKYKNLGKQIYKTFLHTIYITIYSYLIIPLFIKYDPIFLLSKNSNIPCVNKIIR